MKRLKIWVYGLVVVLIGTLFWYTYPRHVSIELKGVKYQLGEENASFLKPVTVRLEGSVNRSLFGRATFSGTIDAQEDIPFSKENGNVTIKLPEKDGVIIDYIQIKNGEFKIYHLGSLLSNRDMSQVTLLLMHDEGGGQSWSGRDGFMISAPAHTRQEALDISNELMKERLTGGSPLK
ncbi:hypothetical protein [Paenibacillus caui]|uniref:hypothetical protein n=1 Tax=Paenibacillus caui TaxID=2873927 RepID=UPI001CA97196|nr:hypothetical protein [Paenibacillus caui]